MNKKIVFTLITFFSLLLFPSPTSAKIIQGEEVVVNANQVINDDLFIVGNQVQIDGKVNGDVYAVGEEVVINGVISGDVYVAGAVIDISGMVGDDVIAAGANIKVKKAIIGDSLITFGAKSDIDKDTRINGGVIFGAGEYQYSAIANRGMIGAAGIASINGNIKKHLYLRVDDLTLGPKFQTESDVNYYSQSKAIIAQSASVGGEVHFRQTDNNIPGQMVKKRAFTAGGFTIISYLSALLIGSLLLRFFGNFSQLVSDKIEQKFWKTLSWGLTGLLFTIPVVLLIMLTIIGIPLGMMLFALFIIELYLTKVFVGMALGNVIVDKLNLKADNHYLIFASGLALFYILRMLPVIGFLVTIASLLSGLGAIVIVKREYLFPKKKII